MIKKFSVHFFILSLVTQISHVFTVLRKKTHFIFIYSDKIAKSITGYVFLKRDGIVHVIFIVPAKTMFFRNGGKMLVTKLTMSISH